MSVAQDISPLAAPLVRRRADWTRLAVMGDLHMYRLWVRPWLLLSKRILGQINLWWDRRKTFDRKLLAPMIAHVLDIEPDLFLLTGDVTMTSLREEFQDVRAALAVLDGRVPTIAVAGNHDRYTPFSNRRRLMERWMPGIVPDAFPFWKELSPRWTLLAIDAAMPRLFTARGRVGRKQLDAIAARLPTLAPDQGLIVMCHYPAIPKPDGARTLWNHRLDDAGELRQVLRQSPAPIIYLHGHVHKPWHVQFEVQGTHHLVDLNAGAPIMRRPGYPHGQGFWQLDLPESPSEAVKFTHHMPANVEYDAGGHAKIKWEARDSRAIVS